MRRPDRPSLSAARGATAVALGVALVLTVAGCGSGNRARSRRAGFRGDSAQTWQRA